MIAVIAAVLGALYRGLIEPPIRWFEREVFWRKAPFRSVNGPYVLVLRSFSNRMATSRRAYRIVTNRDGSFAPVPDFFEEMPDLTVYRFLMAVKERFGEELVSVSSGTSIDGALTLLSTPESRWFEAVKILAEHAKSIIAMPDDSKGLAQEMEYIVRQHPLKLVVLMPPSDPEPSLQHDGFGFRMYLLEPVDMTLAWEDASRSLAEVGVALPPYTPNGRIVTFDSSGSVADAMDAWVPHVLAWHLGEPRTNCGDAESARKALRAAGFHFRRYPLSLNVDPDPTWNRPDFDPIQNFWRLQQWAEENDTVADEDPTGTLG